MVARAVTLFFSFVFVNKVQLFARLALFVVFCLQLQPFGVCTAYKFVNVVVIMQFPTELFFTLVE